MTGCFLDTSAIYASADPRETRHADCRREYEQAIRGSERIVTTDLVVAELHVLALRRSTPSAALELVDRLLASDRIEVLASSGERMALAVDLLRSRPGRPYSLADAVAFVVMRETGIRRAITLDGDFEAEGFEVTPA